MSTFLSLSANTAAAERVKPVTGETPAQSRVRQNLGGLSQAYHALAMVKKGGWQLAANTLNTSQGRVGRHKLSANNTFITINSALLASGQTILSDAPATLTAPPLLPNITLTGSASDTVVNRGQAADAFTLTLNSPAAYASPVRIQAAAPAPAGKNTFPDADFRTIGSVPSLTTAPTDITTLYQNTYGPAEPGAQIALKLIAVSPNGTRLAPLVLTGVVTPAAKSPLQIT